MKKHLTIIFMLILSSFNSTAFAGNSASLAKIENSFYGVDYAEESDEKRLERLEETVYGEIKKGNTNTRLSNLSKDIAADMIGKEINPSTDTYRDDSPKYSDNYEEVAQVPDSSASYPVIDTMEDRLFKQTYKNSDIKNRITHLEKEAFNQIYPSDDLYTRVERLKKSVLIEENRNLAHFNDVFTPTNPTYEDFENYSPNYANNSFDSTPIRLSESQITKGIGKLEKQILKKKYTDESTDDRLSRMEREVFQTEFSSDDSQLRLERLASAYQAQKASTRYDSNKITRNMSTFVQIGMTVLMILAMVL